MSLRVFARLPATTRPGDRVTLSLGVGTVDTAHLSEDLRDAKCTVILDEPRALEEAPHAP